MDKSKTYEDFQIGIHVCYKIRNSKNIIPSFNSNSFEHETVIKIVVWTGGKGKMPLNISIFGLTKEGKMPT